MTGFLDDGANPISRMTIGAFADLGYSVDYAQADTYRLPSATELLLLATLRAGRGHVCATRAPEPRVLPESALAG